MTPKELTKICVDSAFTMCHEGKLSRGALTLIVHEAILEAIQDEANRARKFESEANQEYREKLLLRNECQRLSEVIEVLTNFIEESHGDVEIPRAVREAIEAYFPPDLIRLSQSRENAAPAPGETATQQAGSSPGENAIPPALPLNEEKQ
jgi:hypothetical protein